MVFPHDELHTGDGHAVAQRPIPGGVRGVGESRPAIRETLEAFAFQRRQAADQSAAICLLTYQVCGIFILSGAFCRGHIVIVKYVYTLSGIKNAVLFRRRPVSRVSLFHQRQIVASGPARAESVGAMVCGPVYLHRCRGFHTPGLMPVLLSPQGPRDPHRTVHHAAALVIQTYNRWHAVPTWTALEVGATDSLYPMLPAPAPAQQKTGYERFVGLYPGLSLQRTCYIVQVTHLIPLVGGECDLHLRTILTAAWICDKGLHLKVLRRHQCTGHTVQVNAFIALIDMVGFRFAGYGRGRVKPCCIRKAASNKGGSDLPRQAARRRIPRHAVWDSEYRDGAVAAKSATRNTRRRLWGTPKC